MEGLAIWEPHFDHCQILIWAVNWQQLGLLSVLVCRWVSYFQGGHKENLLEIQQHSFNYQGAYFVLSSIPAGALQHCQNSYFVTTTKMKIKKREVDRWKLPAGLWSFSGRLMGALVVCPWREPPLEGNLRRGEAVVLVGGALVDRNWGRAGWRSAGRLVLFLTVLPLSGTRGERYCDHGNLIVLCLI